MKWEGHISTGMYEFLGFTDFEGTLEEAAQLYREIREEMAPKPISNVEGKEWLALVNKVAAGSSIQGDPGMLNDLNPTQRFTINEIKKWRKRVTK